MFVPEFKPKLYVKDVEVDNVSPDGKVFFKEEGHHYYHIDDIIDGEIVNFKLSKHEFKSPTGILSLFKEKFDAIAVSEQYVAKHGLDITAEELRAEWNEKARIASERGSEMHAYCESKYDGWDFGYIPEHPQVPHADDALDLLERSGWKLAKTELLVYNTRLKLAGQVDLLLQKKMKSSKTGKVVNVLGIFDYKFLKEPIQRKSFYNSRTKKYKMMYGPFKHLMDCNLSHYSIQMEMYKMLMGPAGKKVVKKTLLVITKDGFEFVDGIPIDIWTTPEGILHARYRKFNGDIYDSSKDEDYLEYPHKIV